MTAVAKEHVVLTDEADRFTTEEQAVSYFTDQKKLFSDKLERRNAIIAEAKRHDPKDPNLPLDQEVVEQTKAIMRGYDDAIAAAQKRAVTQRSIAAKPAALVAKGA